MVLCADVTVEKQNKKKPIDDLGASPCPERGRLFCAGRASRLAFLTRKHGRRILQEDGVTSPSSMPASARSTSAIPSTPGRRLLHSLDSRLRRQALASPSTVWRIACRCDPDQQCRNDDFAAIITSVDRANTGMTILETLRRTLRAVAGLIKDRTMSCWLAILIASLDLAPCGRLRAYQKVRPASRKQSTMRADRKSLACFPRDGGRGHAPFRSDGASWEPRIEL